MTKPMFDFARASGNDSKIGQLNPTLRQGIGHGELTELRLRALNRLPRE